MSSCPENPEDAEERKCSICGDKNKENLLNAAICYVCFNKQFDEITSKSEESTDIEPSDDSGYDPEEIKNCVVKEGNEQTTANDGDDEQESNEEPEVETEEEEISDDRREGGDSVDS